MTEPKSVEPKNAKPENEVAADPAPATDEPELFPHTDDPGTDEAPVSDPPGPSLETQFPIAPVAVAAALRLKMMVQSVKAVANNSGEQESEEVNLQAVYGPQGSANEQWSRWTPQATLYMQINNPGAFGKLRRGDFVHVDLTPTDRDTL